MYKNNLSFNYEGNIYDFHIDGEVFWGKNFCMLEEDENLLSKTSFNDKGFNVIDFLHRSHREDIRNGIIDYLKKMFFGNFSITDFSEYHKIIDDKFHFDITKNLVGIPLLNFPINPNILVDFFSDLLQFDLALRPNHTQALEPHFCLRIVRPNSNDNNPLHRDVWLDRLRNAVNIFFPITIPKDNSNLGLVPGSHYWKESDIQRTVSGAFVNGKKYTVPSVVNTKRKLIFIRPKLNENHVLIFSPYLIHGGAINFSDRTRISLEMRFWRRKD